MQDRCSRHVRITLVLLHLVIFIPEHLLGHLVWIFALTCDRQFVCLGCEGGFALKARSKCECENRIKLGHGSELMTNTIYTGYRTGIISVIRPLVVWVQILLNIHSRLKHYNLYFIFIHAVLCKPLWRSVFQDFGS